MNFYEMVSGDSANSLDREISLRNPCYKKISCASSSLLLSFSSF